MDGAVVELVASHDHHSPNSLTRGITGSNPPPHIPINSYVYISDTSDISTPHTTDVAQQQSAWDPKRRLVIISTHESA